MKRWREIYPRLLPSWLTEGYGGQITFSMMCLLDAFEERARQGLQARFPTRAGLDSAVNLTGESRAIQRGRSETTDHYAARLTQWLSTHKGRGSAQALLEQVSEYFSGWPCYTIDAKGTRCDYDGAGNFAYSYDHAWDWDGDPSPELRWARFWIVLLPPVGEVLPQLEFGDPDLWGGALFQEGYAIGHRGVDYRDANAIKRLTSRTGTVVWRPAGTTPQYLIVSLDGSEPVPDGTWEYDSYLDSVGAEDYPGSDIWHDSIPLVGGTTYEGADVWHDTTTLYGGYEYAAVDAWHETVTAPGSSIVRKKRRSEQHRFWALCRDVQDYVGEDRFPSAFEAPDGSVISGNPVWRDVIELLDGDLYAGEDTWRDHVALPDDGSLPL